MTNVLEKSRATILAGNGLHFSHRYPRWRAGTSTLSLFWNAWRWMWRLECLNGTLSVHCNKCGCSMHFGPIHMFVRSRDRTTTEIHLKLEEAFHILKNRQQCVSMPSPPLLDKEIAWLATSEDWLRHRRLAVIEWAHFVFYFGCCLEPSNNFFPSVRSRRTVLWAFLF